MENNTKIDFFQLKKTALILRALNHKLRQQIFSLLEVRGKLTVTDIYVELKLEQSVASQHLAILRTAGIVKTEREGKFVYYKLNHERIAQIDGATKQFL
jgi:DNA-binding transcriptional ArsR family regulator